MGSRQNLFHELLIEDTEGHLAHPDIVDVNRASGAVGVGNIEADLGGAGSFGNMYRGESNAGILRGRCGCSCTIRARLLLASNEANVNLPEAISG